ncbi:hypothetical protein LIPSTDRAFT_65756 [Lipomyces starkeyi NRRL Y-11557]|uniref:Retrotransposon gag domain-containing protein n=1 Tax=Lipomyces starkeyi NRRL Y-11557 TaxID=675824 RepID=A0A1E3PX81_LIPST|nr:hypothetical protein LIPSTDRAFT_65756 [Lipomyces starkeyi NRRL Y-11557]
MPIADQPYRYQILNFERFLTQFEKTFGNPDARGAAVQKVRELTQATCVSLYIADLMSVIAKLDWNDAAYRGQFCSSLKSTLMTRSRRSGNIDNVRSACINEDDDSPDIVPPILSLPETGQRRSTPI